MSYEPGTHVIATLSVTETNLLNTSENFRILINRLINEFKLTNLGEVYHDFQPAGFTAVVCLSESHISIHTWPEHCLLNIDIYLSNFQRNNDGTVDAIFSAVTKHFNATILSHQSIRR